MSNVMSSPVLDEKELRKAWLKQKFGSFEYHEEMLRLHAEWMTLIYRALARPEVQRNYPEEYKFFMGPAKTNFDDCALPGQLDPTLWKAGQQAGFARDILDYGRDSGLDVEQTWNWMTEDERSRMNDLWDRMAQMAQNIRRTVDDTWERVDPYTILNERYTGPITWPPDWREEVLGAGGGGLLGLNAPRVRAGDPAPQAGQWRALDGSARVQRADVGDVLPDLKSAYGITIWQRVGS